MVTQTKEQTLQSCAVRLLNHHSFHSLADRGIVFCDTVDDATTLANLINAPFYVGPMDGEARSTALRRWRSGHSRWLCATSAFAQGVDYGHVTYVLHYRVPKHMTLFAQQSGRLARREGVVGVSHLLYSDPPTRRDSADVDLGGFNAIVDLTTKAQCRRLSMTAFLDATQSNCNMLGPCQLCDFCARQKIPFPPAHHPRPLPEVPANHSRTFDTPATGSRPQMFSNALVPSVSALPRPDATRRPVVSNISSSSTNVSHVSTHRDIPAASLSSKFQKEANVSRFLQESEGMCILHILAGDVASHRLFTCPIYSTFSSPYIRFRSNIRYTRTGICYRCAVLTSDRFNHPNRSKTDDVPCKFDDILKPLAFAIFSIPEIRDVVLPAAGVQSPELVSSDDYAKWLGTVPAGPQALFNIWEVCHAYVHLTDNNGVPTVSVDDILRAFAR
ncbi:hypothetical protein JVT61DRAFT_4263 [Boletus reticuloceps]|uniref:DNA 3'-5' helicase n=1 Tax=Boletus reticuloceps TaxID=495285 RepID=A0A8I2YLT1_9AGAM|nr:hypothetical protein JVT61DRAFT_4263 [Boletus reticuloceps]